MWLQRWLGVTNVTCGYRDGWGRRCTQLVAIDALVFDDQSNQFETSKVSRELNKVCRPEAPIRDAVIFIIVISVFCLAVPMMWGLCIYFNSFGLTDHSDQ